jgi:hypothetical protein
MFNQMETRQILKFFWPGDAAKIDQMLIADDVRRVAQTALVAGIDGSDALGFMESTFRSVLQPGSSLKSFGQKLARSFMRNWWKHATIKDLHDVNIYIIVRDRIADVLKSHFSMAAQGASFSGAGIFFSYQTLVQSFRA